ncbi:MAG: carboxyl-terminal protease [Bacteroidetes bacterium]|nr:MAG: carboxyl-terminal protease [Bacteroidota bacterium]
MKKLQVWIPLLFALVMIVGMLIGYHLYENTHTNGFFKTRKIGRVQEVLDLVNMKYVDPVNPDSLSDQAIQGILAHLDPHSYFIPAVDREEMNEDLQGNFEGIGVEFQIFNDTVNITYVLPNGPSDKAGLQVGDKFIKVNDSLVAGNGINSERIKKLLRGPGASTVTIGLLREGRPVTSSIVRGMIPLPSLDAAYMLDKETGYIRINKFSRTTYGEVMEALEKLQKQGFQKLVFDLRNNGGGIVDQAVDIADEFLGDDKLIVYTEGRKSPRREYRAQKPGVFEKGKLILLVDEGTASASEILAGALQDWDRATIMGRRTFGKGLVQEPFQLSDGSELRLTVARYYTPIGRSIQKPYNRGRDEYNDEVLERFHDGELIHGDTSSKHAGPVFHTKGGRVVYGGGGITPDVFVGLDTSRVSMTLTDLYKKGTLNNFVYTYYMANISKFRQFKDADAFIAGFHDDDKIWNSLVEFAAKDSVNMSSITPGDKSMLQSRMKALLARLMWRTQGYFEVSNSSDPVVRKAMEEFSNKVAMPLKQAAKK